MKSMLEQEMAVFINKPCKRKHLPRPSGRVLFQINTQYRGSCFALELHILVLLVF